MLAGGDGEGARSRLEGRAELCGADAGAVDLRGVVGSNATQVGGERGHGSRDADQRAACGAGPRRALAWPRAART